VQPHFDPVVTPLPARSNGAIKADHFARLRALERRYELLELAEGKVQEKGNDDAGQLMTSKVDPPVVSPAVSPHFVSRRGRGRAGARVSEAWLRRARSFRVGAGWVPDDARLGEQGVLR
jgi:hypothetical protein